jgi:hypothetical protein
MRASVIGFCVNCRGDLPRRVWEVFPHYCDECLRVLRSTGNLPFVVHVQEELNTEE